MRKESDLLTVTDAAAEKQVSRQAVAAAVKAGRLKGQKYGRFYLIRRSDLAAWEVVGHRRKKQQP